MLVSSFSILGNFVLEFSDASFFNHACFVSFRASFSNNASFFSSLTCLLFSEFSGHPTRTFKQNSSNVVSCVLRSFHK